MTTVFNSMLPYLFTAGSLSYIWLAVMVARLTPDRKVPTICYFLILIGCWLAGTTFEYNTTSASLFGIGRTLTFISAGFLPVVLFAFYLEFSESKRKAWIIAALSMVPLVTVILAATNSTHHLIWTMIESVDGAIRFTRAGEHAWFNLVHAPFAYGVFTIAVIGIASRLPSIATAHRKRVLVLLFCMLMPFLISISESLLHLGRHDFPYTSCAFVALLPLYAWATLGLKFYDFSPLAYRTMFDKVKDPIIVLDKNKCIVSANMPAQQLLGQTENQLIGKELWKDYPEARELLEHVDGDTLRQTVRMRNGRFFELQGAPLDNNEGMIVVCRDVTDRKNAQRALADSEQLIRSLVENSSNGILRFSRDNKDSRNEFRCIFANSAAEDLLQWGEGNLEGVMLNQLELLKPNNLISHFDSSAPRNSSMNYEAQSGRGDDALWLRIIAEPVGVDFAVTLIDITATKNQESRILDDAQRDSLTGVLNRRGFEAVASRLVGDGLTGAVVYIDLDDFKAVNDRFGHQAGDALLKAFGHRLEFCLRPEDVLARLGGDEFAIMLPGVSIEDARHVAKRLSDTASDPYLLHAREIVCTASVGIAMMPTTGADLWMLIAAADRSMYEVKAGNRGDAANETEWDSAAG